MIWYEWEYFLREQLYLSIVENCFLEKIKGYKPLFSILNWNKYEGLLVRESKMYKMTIGLYRKTLKILS